MLHNIWCFCQNYCPIVLYMLSYDEMFIVIPIVVPLYVIRLFISGCLQDFLVILGFKCDVSMSDFYPLDIFWVGWIYVLLSFISFEKFSFIVFSSISSILAFSLLIDKLNWYCPIALKSSVPFFISFFFVFQFEYFLLTYLHIHCCFLHCVEFTDEFVKGNPLLCY